MKENTDCLVGLKCQECGSLGPFNIVSECLVDWFDSGTDNPREFGFEDDSPAVCCGCLRSGTVLSLLKDPTP